MTNNEQIFVKTLIRTKFLIKLGIHSSTIEKEGTLEITSDNRMINKDNYSFQSINEDILRNSKLHCNHYPIQSFEWFQTIKIDRGSAAMAVNDHIRNHCYYNSFESHSNQILDDELSKKRSRFQVYYGYGKDNYHNVTRKVIRYFLDISRTRITIGENITFNDYLGDPAPKSTQISRNSTR